MKTSYYSNPRRYLSEGLCEVQPPNGDGPLEHSNLADLAASDDVHEQHQLVVVVVGVGSVWVGVGGARQRLDRTNPVIPVDLCRDGPRLAAAALVERRGSLCRRFVSCCCGTG